MSKKKEKMEKEEITGLNFGIGNFSLGGLFDGINKLVDLTEKLEEAGGGMKKESEFKVDGHKGIFGFSVRNIVGKDGKGTPVVQHFGNIKKSDKGTVIEDTREPIVDVFKTDDVVQIVAELPGVLERKIQYTIAKDIFTLSTTGSRKYEKEIKLPYPVYDKPVESNYNAGIWQIKFKKKA